MFNTKLFMFFLIGLSLSLFAQDSLFAQQNKGQKVFFGDSPDKVIQYADYIYKKMNKMSIENRRARKEGNCKLTEFDCSLTEGLTNPYDSILDVYRLNYAVDIFNRYIEYINDRMGMLIECQKIKDAIQSSRIQNKCEQICIYRFCDKNVIAEQKLNNAIKSGVIPFQYLDNTKHIIGSTDSSPDMKNDARSKKYAYHMNEIFNHLAQILQIENTGFNDFLNDLNKKLNAIHTNRYTIFQWYQNCYYNKQNSVNEIIFINDDSASELKNDSNNPDVFFLINRNRREDANARDKQRFFIENQPSQAGKLQASVARYVYEFMNDKWDVRFTYHDNLTTESQSDCDYRPWLVIGSFLQFVSVNRYNCNDLLEFFPDQPDAYGFDWNCLQNDNLYPERFNSFLEKWIKDKFAYDCKLETGLTEPEKTEVLLDILKEQLNIVKPRLRYIKNHTKDANVAEFIRHIIDED